MIVNADINLLSGNGKWTAKNHHVLVHLTAVMNLEGKINAFLTEN